LFQENPICHNQNLKRNNQPSIFQPAFQWNGANYDEYILLEDANGNDEWQ